jgi:leucyl aminopeptidase (aminopeptidase T)
MEGDGEHVDWEALHQELDEIHEIVDEAKSELAVTAPAPPGMQSNLLRD